MNHLNRDHQPRTCGKRGFVWITGLVMAVTILAFPDAWALQVSPTNLTFQAVQGGTNPPSQTVNVLKKNSRQLSWTGADNATWLSVSPMSGSVTRSSQISVSVNPTGLAAGTYTAIVTITVTKGGSISVPVTLTVASTATASPTSTGSTAGTTAMLAWSPNTASDLAGYKVYVGTAPGFYGSPINVGNVASYALTNLLVGSTYYFAVTAYDSNGNESGFSNEVSKSIY